MPTARELLEQADALMRRNRGAGSEDVPVLTDVVGEPPGVDDDVPVLTAVVQPAPKAAPEQWQEEGDSGIDIDADLAAMGPEFLNIDTDQPLKEPEFVPMRGDTRVPMLELPKETQQYRLDPVSPPAASGPSASANRGGSGISGEMLEKTLPLSELLMVPSKGIEAQFIDVPPGAPLPDRPAARPAAPPPASVPEPVTAAAPIPEPPRVVDLSAQTQELTEQITLQVLQKLDIYTERGLQDHLSQHLKPMVEKAVGDLVTTINANVGRVIRAFVAESIEREIENFRKEIAESVKRAHDR